MTASQCEDCWRLPHICLKLFKMLFFICPIFLAPLASFPPPPYGEIQDHLQATLKGVLSRSHCFHQRVQWAMHDPSRMITTMAGSKQVESNCPALIKASTDPVRPRDKGRTRRWIKRVCEGRRKKYRERERQSKKRKRKRQQGSEKRKRNRYIYREREKEKEIYIYIERER